MIITICVPSSPTTYIHTHRSIILPLPSAFVQWLQTDGVILPSTVTLSSVGKAGLDNLPDEEDGEVGSVERERAFLCTSSYHIIVYK